MTQAENNLAALCQAQGDELVKCRQALVDAYNDREDAHEVIRDLLGAISSYQEYATSIPHMLGLNLAEAKRKAFDLLGLYITEDE